MTLGLSPGRAPARGGPVGMAITLFTLLALVLMGRFFYLQILRGEDFKERARISFIAKERIPARRGRILDRRGKILADNAPSYEVRLIPHYLLKSDNPGGVLRRLATLVDLTEAELGRIETSIQDAVDADKRWEPIRVRANLSAETCAMTGDAPTFLKKPIRRLVDPVTGERFDPIGRDATFSPHTNEPLRWDSEARNWASCARCGRTYVTAPISPVSGAILRVEEYRLACGEGDKQRLHVNQVAAIKAVIHTLPGVEVRTRFQRIYPQGYEMAHTLGYMNRVTAQDRENHPGIYALSDVIGRSGAERAFERYLRGNPGETLYIRDSRGRRRDSAELRSLMDDVEFRRAEAGQDVSVTLDLALQEEVRRAFRYYQSGGAAIIDPNTGDVLALYSKPGFDPNIWSGRLSRSVWEETNANPYTPLLHKGVTAYAPGSVYKIVTATAGLTEGIVTKDTTINCPGHYDYGGRRFHCHNRSGHGPMNIVNALKHSCDVYFYRVGEMMGMDTLARYGKMYGFGAATGIEINSRNGRVPTKEWHAKHDALGWQPGFTLSTAIGQGALTATTLQVARSFAALLNGGDLLQLHLIKERIAENGDLLYRAVPQSVGRIEASADTLGLIREGLVRVVNDANGTASDVAMSELVFAGKTGTAEAAESRPGANAEFARWLKGDHAWFAGYAPAEDPQVVVVVFVEHGGGGSKMAAPIAKRIVKSWMRLGFYTPFEPDATNDPLDPSPDQGDEP